jgi:hypothetical protein
MKQRSDEELVLRRYLLGDLDEPLMDEVEGRLLRDKIYADRLSAVEDNLIDDYVFEGLSEREREGFNTNFLVNDERRKKIMIAQAMEVYVGERCERQSVHEPLTLSQLWQNSVRFLQGHKLSVAFSLLIIVLLAVFVPRMLRSLVPNGPISPLTAQRSDIERRIAELNRHNNDTRPLVQVTLQPLVLREGSEIRKLTITREARLVNINLQLPTGNRYESYRVIMQTVEGTELFGLAGLKAGENEASSGISFKLTDDVLPQGDYQIRLIGRTSENVTIEVARYNLRVIRDAAV